jgi:hypothetical protein
VGLALFHGDQLLAVANSNRFNAGAANLAILDVADPTKASVAQTICTGLFPVRSRWAPTTRRCT